jgi:hypothetical protein
MFEYCIFVANLAKGLTVSDHIMGTSDVSLDIDSILSNVRSNEFFGRLFMEDEELGGAVASSMIKWMKFNFGEQVLKNSTFSSLRAYLDFRSVGAAHEYNFACLRFAADVHLPLPKRQQFKGLLRSRMIISLWSTTSILSARS